MTDFANLDIPPRKTLLSPWLKDKSITMIAAGRGVGKSHFAWGLVKSISSNDSFGVWKNGEINCPNILILDGEMPGEEIIERQGSHKLPPNVFIRSTVMENDYKTYPGLLLNPDYRNTIQRYCHDSNIKLMVIDNKSSFSPGLTENENGGEWDKVNGWMLDMRNQGINIILITHTGKDASKGSRGASSVEDNVDTVIILKDKKKESKSDYVSFQYEFTKCRARVDYIDTAPRIMTFSPDDRRRYSWNIDQDEEFQINEIQKGLESGLTQKEIATNHKWSESKVSRLVTGNDLKKG